VSAECWACDVSMSAWIFLVNMKRRSAWKKEECQVKRCSCGVHHCSMALHMHWQTFCCIYSGLLFDRYVRCANYEWSLKILIINNNKFTPWSYLECKCRYRQISIMYSMFNQTVLLVFWKLSVRARHLQPVQWFVKLSACHICKPIKISGFR
jgi:hypothetical protein